MGIYTVYKKLMHDSSTMIKVIVVREDCREEDARNEKVCQTLK